MTNSQERTSRFAGDGFRVEPEYRQASGTPEGYPDDIEPITAYTPESQFALPGPRGLTAAELDGAFDDPEHGEPGRDRMVVHVIWEAVLLLATLGMAFAVSNGHHGALGGVNLRTLMVNAAIVGVLALGAGLSLRAGAVNLAVGPIFVLSGLLYADHSGEGFYAAAGTAVAIAAVCGLAIAVVVAVFHVPGWAASLAAIFGILVWETHLPQVATLTTHYNPAARGYYWYGAFVVIALIGGLLGAFRPVRRGLGRFRPVSDPARRRGTSAAVVAALAIVGSAVLAGVAGVASTMQQGSMTSTDGLSFTGMAVGIALLGGVSAFGRRGGIFGTALAASLFALAIDYVGLHAWRGGQIIVIVATLAIGVIVTRVVEIGGRPDHRKLGEDPMATLSWLGRQQGSWTRELPSGPEPDQGWVDEPEERWRTR